MSDAKFAKATELLNTYRDPDAPGGYKIYAADLKTSDGAALSKTIQALQEPLSKIAEKVATVRLDIHDREEHLDMDHAQRPSSLRRGLLLGAAAGTIGASCLKARARRWSPGRRGRHRST